MDKKTSAVLSLLFLVASLVVASESDLASEVGRMARVGACWSPSFSPDGSQIAFVSDLNGVPQIWIVATEGGWPRLVTALDDQIGGVEWSPDGEWLAFSLAPGGGMNQQLYLVRPDGSELSRFTDGGHDNNWLGNWSQDGHLLAFSSNRADPGTMHSYLYQPSTGEMRLVAENPGIGSISALSSDAKKAVLYRMESRSSDNLFVRYLETGEEHLLTPHEGPGSFRGGRFSSDGKVIYLASNQGRDRVAFARIELDSEGKPGPISVLAERENAELQAFEISEDGSRGALLWNVAGRNELDFLDLETLEAEAGPTLPSEIAGNLQFSRDGRLLVMTLTGAAAPQDIWILEIDKGKLKQITHSPHAGIDLAKLVQPELLTYEAHDGLELSGRLYRPVGASGPLPFVLSFHGGPEGQERPRFRSDYQALVARGIGVFAPNVRGSSGFGKRFVNLDNLELRYDGIEDAKSTAEFLLGEGLAEPGRIGIMGGSYGGYMTMAGLAWYPELFAAGANLFGVVNFETFFAQTEPWMAAISTLEYGDPESQAELLRDLSPIHRVSDVRAPTIVLHGAKDMTNVPVIEAEQVVENLESRGVPVEYVLFADEGHGFRKTQNKITATIAVVEWFDRYLKKRE